MAPCDSSNGGHVLGWSCSDTYGVGNNNSPFDLGPRRELVPAKGQFGRCGSIFDVGCDGIEDGVSTDVYRDRMLVKESDLQACRAAPNGDALCWFESWYIVRDDINIYNTMATRGIVPTYGASWTIANANSGADVLPARFRDRQVGGVAGCGGLVEGHRTRGQRGQDQGRRARRATSAAAPGATTTR